MTSRDLDQTECSGRCHLLSFCNLGLSHPGTECTLFQEETETNKPQSRTAKAQPFSQLIPVPQLLSPAFPLQRPPAHSADPCTHTMPAMQPEEPWGPQSTGQCLQPHGRESHLRRESDLPGFCLLQTRVPGFCQETPHALSLFQYSKVKEGLEANQAFLAPLGIRLVDMHCLFYLEYWAQK